MSSETLFHPPSVCLPQGGVCVCRVTVYALMAGQVKAAVVPSLQRPVNQPTGCFAVGGADVCAASVYAMTHSTLESSATSVLRAKAPANHTGTVSVHRNA